MENSPDRKAAPAGPGPMGPIATDGPGPGRFVCVLAFRERRPILRRRPREGRKRLPLLRRRKPRPPKAPKPNKFLLIFNQRRGWELPGGSMEPGETPETAAAREFLEETGYEVSLVERISSERGEYFIGKLGRRRGKPADPDIKEIQFLVEVPKEGLGYAYEEYAELVRIARGKGF